jgi:conjugal transfer pilus assembly protein TraA
MKKGDFRSWVALLAVMALWSGQVLAGADTTFDPVNTILQGWMSGSYGKLAALASMGVGLIIAVVTKSLMAMTVSAGIAIAANYGPPVITGIMTATL